MSNNFLVITALLLSAPFALAQNLVTNGDFATDLSGWTVYDSSWNGGSFGVSTTTYGGKTTAASSYGASGSSEGYMYQIIDVAAGQSVKLTADWASTVAAPIIGDYDGFYAEIMFFSFADANATSTVDTSKTMLLDALGAPSSIASNGGVGGIRSKYANGLWGGTTPFTSWDWESAPVWDETPSIASGDTIISSGQVVVAMKLGLSPVSGFDSGGSLMMTDVVMEKVPEPITLGIMAAGAVVVFTRRRDNLRYAVKH